MICTGSMFDTARYDAKFAGIENDDTMSEFQPHLPSPHQEHLVFLLVMVPRKLALELDEFDLLAVQFGDYLGSLVLSDQR